MGNQSTLKKDKSIKNDLLCMEDTWDQAALSRDKFIKKIGINIEVRGVKGNAYFMQLCHNALLKSEDALELGTGTGAVPIFVGHLGKKMICVDSSLNMLKIAKTNCRKFCNISFKKASMNKLPFSDCHFDLIIKRLAPDNLNELSRVLKKRGTFLNLTNGELDAIELRKLFKKEHHQGIKEYRAMLKNNNFKIVEEKIFKFKEIYRKPSELIAVLEAAPIFEDFFENKKHYKKIIYEYFKNKKEFVLTRQKYITRGTKTI